MKKLRLIFDGLILNALFLLAGSFAFWILSLLWAGAALVVLFA